MREYFTFVLVILLELHLAHSSIFARASKATLFTAGGVNTKASAPIGGSGFHSLI